MHNRTDIAPLGRIRRQRVERPSGSIETDREIARSHRLGACQLILAGRSFVGPLGRKPEPSAVVQAEIMTACLAHGICAFDTTCTAERIAFVRSLNACDFAMTDAQPIVWNFFGSTSGPLPGPSPWTESRWSEVMTDLSPWRGRPILVLHALDDLDADRSQISTAVRWKREGRVAALGFSPGSLTRWKDEQFEVMDFIVSDWTMASASNTKAIFASAHNRGLVTLGTSPITNDWEIDRLAKRLAIFEQRPMLDARARVADALLRFALASPEVDHVVTTMRSAEEVSGCFASASRGPLTAREVSWIEGLAKFSALKDQR